MMEIPYHYETKTQSNFLLVNNWIIRGMQAHTGIATLVTQHIHAVTPLSTHYSVRY